jgi:hypothetical protein
MDGALLFNNPVLVAYKEALLAFDDRSPKVIDVLLSLGTGLDELVMPSLATSGSASRPISKDAALNTRGPLRTLFMVVRNQVALMLQAEVSWNRLLAVPSTPKWQKDRFRRINPSLGENAPEIDHVAKFGETIKLAKAALASPEMRGIISQVAKELVASCFYFKLTKRVRWDHDANAFICAGEHIRPH